MRSPRLAGDAALRRRMGDASAAKAIRDFDQQNVIDITLGVYDEFLRDVAVGSPDAPRAMPHG